MMIIGGLLLLVGISGFIGACAEIMILLKLVSKQPIRSRYEGHVTGDQPIRDQYFLIGSVPAASLAKLTFFQASLTGS